MHLDYIPYVVITLSQRAHYLEYEVNEDKSRVEMSTRYGSTLLGRNFKGPEKLLEALIQDSISSTNPPLRTRRSYLKEHLGDCDSMYTVDIKKEEAYAMAFTKGDEAILATSKCNILELPTTLSVRSVYCEVSFIVYSASWYSKYTPKHKIYALALYPGTHRELQMARWNTAHVAEEVMMCVYVCQSL